MKDAIKNKVHGVYKSVAESVLSVPKETKFLEKGVMIPDEFMLAGD
jgi:hypothetical protein